MADRTGKVALGCALSCALGALAAAPAAAAPTCNLTGQTLTITLAEDELFAGIAREGATNIIVKDDMVAVACNAQPTVNNTDLIVVNDPSGGDTGFRIDLQNGVLAPGADDEDGTSDEIELNLNMGSGDDSVTVIGAAGDQRWHLGTISAGQGANLNAFESPAAAGFDVDLRLFGVDDLSLISASGDDSVLASGGTALFTGPLGLPLYVMAGNGDDVLAGGDGNDYLQPSDGTDQVYGGAGDDLILQYATGGDDQLDGGTGADTLQYASPQPLRVDLALTGRQDTGGAGLDVITNLENVTSGSGGADVIIGDGADNRLNGGEGDDLLIGRGGTLDVLFGSFGVDTVSYEGAPQGVNVSLAQQPATNVEGPSQDTGGAGVDRLSGFENLTGGPFADALGGDEGANTVQARDGEGDSVTCAGGADTVIADVVGVDALAADCEGQSFDLRPDTQIVSGPRSLSSDPTPSFSFQTTKPGSTLECSLDSAAFAGCGSPLTLPGVSDGAHSFRVRSRDLLSALDLSPATHAFSVDTTAPRITKARIAKAGKASAVTYRLSEDATVKIKIERCAKRKGRAGCKRYATVRTLTRHAKQGTNRAKLRSRVKGRKARHGLYRATLRATDALGHRSKHKRVRFRVVKG